MLVSPFSFANPAVNATPIQPVRPGRPLPDEAYRTSDNAPFGPAVIVEARALREADSLYGRDGRMQSPAARAASLNGQGEETGEARTTQALEQRDREVRQKEDAQGEAVGGSSFIYQTGPDGQQYAVGSAPHVVRKDDPSAAKSTGGAFSASGEKLSPEDAELQEKLEARDAKVRQHETAHILAGGGQVNGPATYTYQTGPDGKRYAVGGSVNISITSSPGDEEEGARQANVARRAAMATGEPSLQDMRVAQQASEISARAMKGGLDAYSRQAEMAPQVAAAM